MSDYMFSVCLSIQGAVSFCMSDYTWCCKFSLCLSTRGDVCFLYVCLYRVLYTFSVCLITRGAVRVSDYSGCCMFSMLIIQGAVRFDAGRDRRVSHCGGGKSSSPVHLPRRNICLPSLLVCVLKASVKGKGFDMTFPFI